MAKLRRHSPGHPVNFRNPTTQVPVVGSIVDEVWIQEPDSFAAHASANGGWREAAFVAQLIQWPGNELRVRITYYLRPEHGGADSWYFGGQYAPSMGVEQLKTLIAKLIEAKW
jgi:hypothetical protein